MKLDTFFGLVNFICGCANLAVALVVDSPAWYTISLIGINFFCAGHLLGSRD